jgi:hypothetical protein
MTGWGSSRDDPLGILELENSTRGKSDKMQPSAADELLYD